MKAAVHDLRIDSGGDQFAVSGSTPRLSWTCTVDPASLAGFDLVATVDGVPQKMVALDSARPLFVPWPWAPLPSRARVMWKVRGRTRDTVSEWAESAFEVGLLDADWSARWISPVENSDPGYGRRPAHVLSTTFRADRPIARARLYATAAGVYEASVNGHRAGTAELLPGSTSYDRTLYAQAFDVTADLRAGDNRLEIVLSDGWYRGQVGAFRLPAAWGTVVGARAELHIEYDDESREVVRTDEQWESAPATIVRADLMAGQATDFGARAVPRRPVQLDLVDAPAVDWSPAPPVRVVETRSAVSVTELTLGTWIADFGQNASGWIVLPDLGPAGTRTVIDYGEFLDSSGDLSTSHLDSSRPGEAPITFVQRDEVVSSGDGEVFEPRHTVHGFQYARITREASTLDPRGLAMRVVHTDLRPTGAFACSDEDLVRLHEAARWSFRGNAVDVPTDCPTRERLAWTGDYQVFAPTATRLYDVLGFTRKWLRSVRDDQLADGRIANFSPDGRQIKHHLDDQLAMMTGSAGWGDAIVAVPWEMYQSYGDPEVLAENWTAMLRWVEWCLLTARTTRHHSRSERSPDPLPHEAFLWDGSFHWGEWTEPTEKAADGSRIDPIQHNPMAWFMADKGEVGTAYLYRSTRTVAAVATVLGRLDDARRYDVIAEGVLDAWRTEYLRPGGRTAGDTQAGYVRALAFGLIPQEQRASAAARLVELIQAAGTHLGTGFLSTGDLLPVLADTGYADVAYQLLFQRSAPSWLTMLDRGATTIWEDWEGIDDEGNAHDSLNHYSKGAVIRFLHTHVLGLRQSAGSVAWESFVVAPVVHPSLTWARGSLASPRGEIGVEWAVESDALRVTVDVPPGCAATLEFPTGERVELAVGASTTTRPLGSVPGE